MSTQQTELARINKISVQYAHAWARSKAKPIPFAIKDKVESENNQRVLYLSSSAIFEMNCTIDASAEEP